LVCSGKNRAANSGGAQARARSGRAGGGKQAKPKTIKKRAQGVELLHQVEQAAARCGGAVGAGV